MLVVDESSRTPAIGASLPGSRHAQTLARALARLYSCSCSESCDEFLRGKKKEEKSVSVLTRPGEDDGGAANGHRVDSLRGEGHGVFYAQMP